MFNYEKFLVGLSLGIQRIAIASLAFFRLVQTFR